MTPTAIPFPPMGGNPGRFWRRWVAANALGELLGLGMTALLGGGLLWLTGQASGPTAHLAGAALFVLLGALIEGGAVGFAQGRVLREAVPSLHFRDWIRATIAGAGVAWALGMIPSAVMAIRETSAPSDDRAAVPSEISGPLLYVLAALMGLVLGPILAAFQWTVLRRHTARALWWLPANALAWAFGMVAIFIGTSAIEPGMSALSIIAIAACSLTGAGVVVGAVHGAVLLLLLAASDARNCQVR